MPDRIDPGPGWRLLELREKKPDVYQWLDGMFWRNGTSTGGIVSEFSPPCRVRVYREGVTKAIATRATVICGTPDGARTMNAINRESGLTEYDCERIRRAWENMQVSSSKYIMLEIQREGEP